MLRVDVVVNAPTPYNAALFSRLSRVTDLRVHFEVAAQAMRPWIGDFLDGYEAIVHRGVRIGRWGAWVPGLKDAIRRDVDVLIVGGSYTSPAIADLLLRKWGGTLLVFWGERFRTESVELATLRRAIFRRTDMVLAIGERAAAQYRKVVTGPVSVLPYACEGGRCFHQRSGGRIGFIGQLIERKGVDVLFKACELAGESAIDIVGSGPLEGKLRQFAHARRLDVRWYGERPNAELGSIRDEWLYQVVPSRYDGWGVVVNEALASGVPVVVSEQVGAAELVRADLNGWVHETGDVSALAAALGQAREQSGHRRVRVAARTVGEAFAAGPAAEFAVRVLERPDVPRSFVEEQWGVAVRKLPNWADPENGVPDTVRRYDPPPA